MTARITTFNCENLFGRYRFLDTDPANRKPGFEELLQVPDVVALEGRTGGIKPRPVAEAQRKTTGQAILGAKPDILAVQEVENLATLRIFNHIYLSNYFDRIMLVDGNDNRGIDVGLLIRKGFKADVFAIRSHTDEALAGGFLPKSNRLDTKVLGAAIFSRDCLEVELKVGATQLTLLVNHFKAQDGKPASTKRRLNQANRVAVLVKEASAAGRPAIVIGDLNIDTAQTDYDGSLDPVYSAPELMDPFGAAAPTDRWTHFFASKKEVSRLDYLLHDKALQPKIKGTDIFRKGLSPKCKQYTGARLPSMSGNDLEASDHCPTTVILDL